MIELLTSDPAIFLATACGLVATALVIVRDARAQRSMVAEQPTVALVVDQREPDGMELAA